MFKKKSNILSIYGYYCYLITSQGSQAPLKTLNAQNEVWFICLM